MVLAGCLAVGLAIGVWVTLKDRNPQTGPPAVVKAGCPAVLPGTSDALDDYADMVVWQQRTYVRDEGRYGSAVPAEIRLGRPVTTIGCSLADPSSTEGNRVAPGPWPDGTATGLDRGTPMYAVHGTRPFCLLGVKQHTEVIVYVAVDFDDNAPLC